MLFNTKPGKNEELRYYEINDGAGMLEFTITQKPKKHEDPAIEEITVYLAGFNESGEMHKDFQGFFVTEAGKNDYRWCANGSYYPVRAKTQEAVIRSYLKQYDSAEKIAPDAVNDRLVAMLGENETAQAKALEAERLEAALRSKINLITKLSSKDAKLYQRKFDHFYYVNKECVLLVSGEDKTPEHIAGVYLVELGYDGKHRKENIGAFVKGGWFGGNYESAGERNPYRGKWVWVVDGREIHDYDSTSLNAALKKYLKAHYNTATKIANLEDYVKKQKVQQKPVGRAR